MELRNTRARKQQTTMDSKDLEITLRDLGYYEEGMKVQEMRQIISALQESVHSDDFVWTESDMEQKLRDSELSDIRAENVFNSTMLNSASSSLTSAERRSWQRRPSQSTFDSPITPAQHLTVLAEVHHTFDWSPPARGNPTLHILNELNALNSLTPKIRDRGGIKFNTAITNQTSRDSQHSSYCANSESSYVSSCVNATHTDSGVSVNTDTDTESIFSSNDASTEYFSWHAQNAHAQASTSSVAVSDNSAANEERNNNNDSNEHGEYEESTEF